MNRLVQVCGFAFVSFLAEGDAEALKAGDVCAIDGDCADGKCHDGKYCTKAASDDTGCADLGDGWKHDSGVCVLECTGHSDCAGVKHSYCESSVCVKTCTGANSGKGSDECFNVVTGASFCDSDVCAEQAEVSACKFGAVAGSSVCEYEACRSDAHCVDGGADPKFAFNCNADFHQCRQETCTTDSDCTPGTCDPNDLVCTVVTCSAGDDCGAGNYCQTTQGKCKRCPYGCETCSESDTDATACATFLASHIPGASNVPEINEDGGFAQTTGSKMVCLENCEACPAAKLMPASDCEVAKDGFEPFIESEYTGGDDTKMCETKWKKCQDPVCGSSCSTPEAGYQLAADNSRICLEMCDDCPSLTECTTPVVGYQLKQNTNKEGRMCLEKCDVCEGPEDCETAEEGFQLGRTSDGSKRMCVIGCAICSGPSFAECTEAAEGYTENNAADGYEVDTENGFFADANGIPAACHANCRVCVSDTECTTPRKGYRLTAGENGDVYEACADSECTNCQNAADQCTAKDGYYDNAGVLTGCDATHPDQCQKCNADNKCEIAKDGYYVEGSGSSAAVKECFAGCNKCTGSTMAECTEAQDGFTLVGEVLCLENCDACEDGKSDVCTTSADGYYYDPETKEMGECLPECATCSDGKTCVTKAKAKCVKIPNAIAKKHNAEKCA